MRRRTSERDVFVRIERSVPVKSPLIPNSRIIRFRMVSMIPSLPRLLETGVGMGVVSLQRDFRPRLDLDEFK